MLYNAQLFQQNLAALKRINPEWATLVESSRDGDWTFVTRDEDTLDLERIENGEQKFLHVLTNPKKEAAEWALRQKIDEKTVLYLYGIGLGYYYAPLKEWLAKNPSRLLIFLEDDVQLMRAFLHTENAKDILEDPQIRCVYLKFPLELNFKSLDFLTTALALDSYSLLCFEHYAAFRHENWATVKKVMMYTLEVKYNQVAEFMDLGKSYYFNYYSNLLKLPQSYLADRLFGRFKNIPAIICGAGPSLKKNIEILKTLKDRALFFAGGSGITSVNSFGLDPHFGVAIDPNLTQVSRMVGLTGFETPFFYRNRLYHESLDFIHGPHLYNTGAGGYSLPGYFEKQLNIPAGEPIDEGYNVINYALNLAHELGCNPIITVGVDLAYSGNESYPPGIKVHALHDFKVDFKTKQSKEELIIKKDIYGNDVITLWKWFREADWYSQFAKTHPETKLINATEGGIGFEGVENMALKDVADHYLQHHDDLLGLAHTEIQDAHFGSQVSLKNIKKGIEELINSADECYLLCDKIASYNDSIVKDLLLEKETSADIQGKIDHLIEELEKQNAYKYILKDFSEHYLWVFTNRMKLYQQREQGNQDNLETLARAKLQVDLFNFLKLVLENHNRIVAHILEKHRDKFTDENIELSSTENQKVRSCLQPEGVFKDSFDPNGVLRSRQQFKGDCLDGLSFFYFENGNLSTETRFVQGKREGESLLYYFSGEIYARLKYKNDQLHGIQEYFFSDGSLRSHICYEEGQLNGETCLYYPGNRLKKRVSYQQGKRHGKEVLLRENGFPWIEANYIDDRPAHEAKLWYSDGSLAREIHYDQNGTTVSDQNFVSGGKKIAGVETGYFDQLMQLTNQFTEAIEQIVSKVQMLLPYLRDLEKTEMEKTELQLKELQEQLTYLCQLNELIQTTFSGSPEQEAFWQTDELRSKIEGQLGVLLKQMTDKIVSIEEFIEVTERVILNRKHEI